MLSVTTIAWALVNPVPMETNGPYKNGINDACGGCTGNNTCCSGSCVNMQTDNNNCGSCGNHCGSICANGSCLVCFVPGTKVLLANGKSAAIESLKTGDILLGSKGTHNKVIDLVTMPKESRKIYAFNNGRYFVTGSHPFMTRDGWKAIDPPMAQQENPQIKIGQLKIGDELVTYNGSILLKKIKLKTINNSVVYNPVLDGSHEYYADGYLVHNKGVQP